MNNSFPDPIVKLSVYSLKDFPGVLDDEVRLIDFLELYYYDDIFSCFKGYDIAIRDWSWIRFDGYRMFVVYCCSDTSHLKPGEPILDGIDPWLVIGDCIALIPYNLLPPEVLRLVDMVACRFYDPED